MPDARLPDRWLLDKRLRRLTDSAFRTFVTTLMWSVATRTDGLIEYDDLDSIPGTKRADAQMLVDVGLWERGDQCWLVPEFVETQTTKHEFEVLANARKRDREKKARQRAKKDSPEGPVPGDTTKGTTQDRQGEERRGQDKEGSGALSDLRCSNCPAYVEEIRQWAGHTKCLACDRRSEMRTA